MDNQPPVLFESNGSVRKYILNRPSKLNALDVTMLDLLRPHVIVSAQVSVLNRQLNDARLGMEQVRTGPHPCRYGGRPCILFGR